MDQTVISVSHDEIRDPAAHAAKVIRRERVRIDAADRAILDAMRGRFEAVAAIGAAKRRAGLPVYDAAREAALYARISEMAGDLAPAALALWRVLTAAARRMEGLDVRHEEADRADQAAQSALPTTLTLELPDAAMLTTVTTILAVHECVPAAMTWDGASRRMTISVTEGSAWAPAMLSDLTAQGVRIPEMEKVAEMAAEMTTGQAAEQSAPSRPRCGLLGRKLGHSYSPAIHAALGDYDYDLHEVPNEEDLEKFLKETPFDGLNVTIPYKVAVMAHCATLSPRAKAIGSVNTLVRRPDGTLHGDNTDDAGFTAMVEESGVDPAGKTCVVLGSGGASRTVVAVLKRMGAKRVVVVSRRGEDHYGNLARHADAALLVNATPVGMYPNVDASPVEDLSVFPKLEAVLDLIYNPPKTKLLADAEKRGIRTVNGLRMLVVQAAVASALWGCSAYDAKRCAAIEAAIRLGEENLWLVGMPGVGKTTVGGLLGEALGRPFVDLDAEIERVAGMPIPEIFRTRGEAGFREIEAEAAMTASRGRGTVIATGGGTVLREASRRAMRESGTVVWLQRDLSRLPTEGRPLSEAKGVEKLYAEREPIYRAAAHLEVDANLLAGAEAVAEHVIGRLMRA